jgi:hypothetical protein
MGRRRRIALLAVGGLAVLAAAAWLARPRDEPTRATVNEAVQSFRAENGAGGAGGGSGEPALGVYRYTTRGSESVKTAILGTTHGYDGVSTIVLGPGRCGERERWQVLAGRWTEVEACAVGDGPAPAPVEVTEFHEFFGIGQKDSFHCHSTPLSLKPGARFSSLCESDDSSISTRSRVVGVEIVRVGEEAFDATHVESRSTFGGRNSGTARRDEWRRRSDRLLLRRSVESDADTSRAGGTHYSERYTLRLLSPKPRR